MWTCYCSCLILLLPFLSSAFRVSTDNNGETNNDTCTPPGKENYTQFLVGYGSLMSSASKSRTYPNTSESVAVEIKGYKRLWNCKGVSPSISTTYLGAKEDPEAHFNAVIFALANGEIGLKDYDKRENFYCRQEVPLKNIKVLSNTTVEFPPNAQYWIYVTKPEYSEEPTQQFPIVQSYVDTWLSGCLELGKKYGMKDFAEDCVQTTTGWSKHWENDRIFPRRPFMYQPTAIKIDALLQKTLPTEFKQIHVTMSSNAMKTVLSFPLIIVSGAYVLYQS